MAPRTDKHDEPAPPNLKHTAKSQRIPPPRLYLYFDAIIRHGSIRSAAEALRIASSALNRRLLDLEGEIGTVLFDRLPSGVRLTAAGEVFAAHVRRTLNDARQAGEQINKMQGAFSGHIAIGSAESAAIDVLPGLMASFQAEFAGARFTVAVGSPREILDNLLDDRVDFILTHEEPSHHDVAVLARAPMPFCALMRAGHPLGGAARLNIKECQNFPIVLAQEQLAARTLVNAALNAAAASVAPVLVTNMFEVMKKYVARTDAISFHFHLAPIGGEKLEGLVAVPLADRQLAEAKLALAVRRSRVLPPIAAAVCERIQTLLRESGGGKPPR
jgi:DNA-binding transcriptional LysR family regulator